MEETSSSLLDRLRHRPDQDSWQRLDDIYRPLIRSWVRRDPTLNSEADDLVQDVMAVLVRELPHFQRQRTGSFRRWLREITAHRVQAFWRARHHRPQAAKESVLLQLADPHSDLSRQWDEEHDRHVVQRLLDQIEHDFTPPTWQAFRRVVLDGVSPAVAAAELGLTRTSSYSPGYGW